MLLFVALSLTGALLVLWLITRRARRGTVPIDESWSLFATSLGLRYSSDPQPHLSGEFRGHPISVRVLSERENDDERPYTFFHVLPPARPLAKPGLNSVASRPAPEGALVNASGLVWRRDGISTDTRQLKRDIDTLIDAWPTSWF